VENYHFNQLNYFLLHWHEKTLYVKNSNTEQLFSDKMPKKGPDAKKLNKIINILKSVESNGIWIRELARQSNLPLSTIHLYINKFLEDKVETKAVRIGKFTHSQMKIIKLKVIK
jgi:predicted transcriptional regulator